MNQLINCRFTFSSDVGRYDKLYLLWGNLLCTKCYYSFTCPPTAPGNHKEQGYGLIDSGFFLYIKTFLHSCESFVTWYWNYIKVSQLLMLINVHRINKTVVRMWYLATFNIRLIMVTDPCLNGSTYPCCLRVGKYIGRISIVVIICCSIVAYHD